MTHRSPILQNAAVFLSFALTACGGRTLDEGSESSPQTAASSPVASMIPTQPQATASATPVPSSTQSAAPMPTEGPGPGACECAVPSICQLCDDGSCATADVTCSPDGSCGEIRWACPSEPAQPACDCPVDVACLRCADGSCAAPDPVCDASGKCLDVKLTCPKAEQAAGECASQCKDVQLCVPCNLDECAVGTASCSPDGTCADIEWQCAEPSMPECVEDADCPQLRVACSQCADGTSACPESRCIGGACQLNVPMCPYDPCSDKQDGDSCSRCAPADLDCVDTSEIKECRDGVCISLAP